MNNTLRVKYLKIEELSSLGEVLEQSYCLQIFDEQEEVLAEHCSSFKDLQETVNLNNLIDYLHGNYRAFYRVAVEENGLYFNNQWYSIQELVAALQKEVFEVIG